MVIYSPRNAQCWRLEFWTQFGTISDFDKIRQLFLEVLHHLTDYGFLVIVFKVRACKHVCECACMCIIRECMLMDTEGWYSRKGHTITGKCAIRIDWSSYSGQWYAGNQNCMISLPGCIYDISSGIMNNVRKYCRNWMRWINECHVYYEIMCEYGLCNNHIYRWIPFTSVRWIHRWQWISHHSLL